MRQHLLTLVLILITKCLTAQVKMTKPASEEFKANALFMYGTSTSYFMQLQSAMRPMGYSYSEVDYVMNNLNEKTNFDILCLATRNFANGYRAAMNCTQREALIVQLFHTLQISKASTEQLIKYISSLPENRDTTKDDDREGEKSDKVPAVVLCNEELDSLEKKHSVIYKKLYASLNPQEQSVLKISQQQWIKNREKKCYLTQQEYAGGSMAGLAHCQCTIEEVQKRIEVLSKNNMSIISN